MKSHESYKDGKADGTHEYWWENGQLMSRGDWKDEKAEGLFERWDKSGKLISRTIYKNGKEEKPTPKNTNNPTTVVQEDKKKITLKPKKTNGIKI